MMSKCGKNKKCHVRHNRVCHWCSYHILMSSVIYDWSHPWQHAIYFLSQTLFSHHHVKMQFLGKLMLKITNICFAGMCCQDFDRSQVTVLINFTIFWTNGRIYTKRQTLPNPPMINNNTIKAFCFIYSFH